MLVVWWWVTVDGNSKPSRAKTGVAHDDDGGHATASVVESPSTPLLTQDDLALPPEYHQRVPEAAYCADRFGLAYLDELRTHVVDYCDADSSSSRITCFRSQTAPEGRIDSFCLVGPAGFDPDEKKLQVDCRLRDLTAEERAQKVPTLAQLPPYWYQTGPRVLLDRYVRIQAPASEIPSSPPGRPRSFSILVRREQVANMWHSMMEMMSVGMSLDVLRTTRDPASEAPFFTAQDLDRTQVVILDESPHGPFHDLWSSFGHKPIIHFAATSAQAAAAAFAGDHIILPLPGGSSPFWQGDWEPHACDRSDLLQAFIRRVLDVSHITDDDEDIRLPGDRPLVLTVIDRRGSRRLVHQDAHLEALKAHFPTLTIQLIDFATLSFVDQLRITRRTDVLIGVHGAGLTHAMFLPARSALVEIMPHDFHHQGFRNLAKMLGHHYFRVHAPPREHDGHPAPARKANWQTDDVYLQEDRFVKAVDAAVKSMLHRGLLSEDVN